MKFLALGLLMFLQAGSLHSVWTATGMQEPQQNGQNASNVFIGSDGRCYRVNQAFDKAAQVDDSACRDQFKNTMGNREVLNPKAKSSEIHDDTVMTWQGVYWDGKEASKDVVTFSSNLGGTQSLTVPSDWKCTPFTDGKTDTELIGMVCTKPQKK